MRKVLLAVGAATLVLLAMGMCTTERARAGGISIPQAEMRVLWNRAEQAGSAAELRAMAPPSWGALPWTFEGPVRFDHPAREETAKIQVVAIHDTCRAGVAWINLDYKVLRQPGNAVVRLATYRINKGICS